MNFPDYIIPRDLWCVFRRIGSVSDVFISKIRSHLGGYHLFPLKEASGWIPSFSSNFPKTTFENQQAHSPFDEEKSLYSKHDNEDIYEDPFGVYESLEKMKVDEESKKKEYEGRDGKSGCKEHGCNNFFHMQFQSGYMPFSNPTSPDNVDCDWALVF